MFYAVIDTNVLVSSLLSKHSDSSTVVVLNLIINREIVPLFSDKILEEYRNVLSRPKLGIAPHLADDILELLFLLGQNIDAPASDQFFPDPDDAVFYEVFAAMEGAYLITGNKKHFPENTGIVSPAEMLKVIGVFTPTAG